MGKYKNCTITLNRACNLRCWFCYASDTSFAVDKNMSRQTFDNIKRFIVSADIKRATLIGGEPTIFPDTLRFASELNKMNIKMTLVTNGVLFCSKEFCKKYVDAGIKSYSISIKAPNKEEYKAITGFESFDKTIEGIKNLLALDARVSVSFVITEQNVDSIKEMVENVKSKTDCKNFFFSFCRSFNTEGRADKGFIDKNNPIVTARKFEKLVPWLKENTERVVYAMGEPLCVLSDEFVDNYLVDFSSPCYVHTGTILTFDTDGYLIPCNTIHQIKIGKIGEDFSNFEQFEAFKNTPKYKTIYKRLNGIPDLSCLNCRLFKNCRGRCVCNWTNYNFAELKEMIANYNKN